MAYSSNAAEVLDALGDPTRRAVLELLRDGPRAVVDIASALPVSRPAVSQHLRVLKGAGLVTERKDGTRHLYRVDPDGLAALRTYLESFWTDALGAFKDAAERGRRYTVIEPIRRSVIVRRSAEDAFEVFTAGHGLVVAGRRSRRAADRTRTPGEDGAIVVDGTMAGRTRLRNDVRRIRGQLGHDPPLGATASPGDGVEAEPHRPPAHRARGARSSPRRRAAHVSTWSTADGSDWANLRTRAAANMRAAGTWCSKSGSRQRRTERRDGRERTPVRLRTIPRDRERLRRV